MGEQRTILFWPESAAGPTNNCIGIGHVLAQRGHRVVFAVETSWEGRLAALGFEEHLVDLAEPPEGPVDAGQSWKDFSPGRPRSSASPPSNSSRRSPRRSGRS